MHYRTLLSFVAAFAVSTSALAVSAAPAKAEETVNGYSYQLYGTTRVPADQLGTYPPDAESPRIDHVMQGPEYTLMWLNPGRNKPAVDSASFAQGDKEMGLFIPYWEAGRSASDTTGWSDSGGMTIHYSSFNVEVTRGKEDQDIAGGEAQHYILTADITERGEDNTADTHITLHSNVWVLSDKPFSWAPYSTPGIYADPRLQVAVAEQLGNLGMVVRSDTRYTRESIDDDGEVLGAPYSGTWVAWVTDLKSAQVPVLDMPPLADRQTFLTLQESFRKDTSGACKTILAGSTPAFIKDTLNAEQRKSVEADLYTSCQYRIVGWEIRDIRDNPKAMCKKIMNGWRPAVFEEGISEALQQKYLDFAHRHCKK